MFTPFISLRSRDFGITEYGTFRPYRDWSQKADTLFAGYLVRRGQFLPELVTFHDFESGRAQWVQPMPMRDVTLHGHRVHCVYNENGYMPFMVGIADKDSTNHYCGGGKVIRECTIAGWSGDSIRAVICLDREETKLYVAIPA